MANHMTILLSLRKLLSHRDKPIGISLQPMRNKFMKSRPVNLEPKLGSDFQSGDEIYRFAFTLLVQVGAVCSEPF